jgi:DNA polymerase III delta prime subunit
MKTKKIKENVDRAKREISDAEGDLRKLIAQLQALPRAQKVTVSEAVSHAFEKLQSAHGRLAELEDILDDDD